MIDLARRAWRAHAPQPNKSKLLQLGVAGLLATTVLAAASAQARITQIQILTARHRVRRLLVPDRRPVRVHHRHRDRRGRSARTRRTRSSPTSRSRRATRTATSSYSHNFYILKPVDLEQGQSQDDVRAAEPRRQDVPDAQQHADRHQRSGGDHRSRRARQFVPVDARLHDGVERLGEQSRPAERTDGDGVVPGRGRPERRRRSPARATNTS